jgi:hypothetical protein
VSDEEPMGLMPFDLQAPARLIYPVHSPMRDMERNVTAIDIGSTAGEGTFTVVKQDDGSASAWVTIPCEAMVHDGCRYCECDDSHRVYLTEMQIRELRNLLG